MPLYPPASGGGAMAIGGAVTSGTVGSVLFVGAGGVLAQDATKLTYDPATGRMGINEANPDAQLESVSASATVPAGKFKGAASQSAPVVQITDANDSELVAFGAGTSRISISGGDIVVSSGGKIKTNTIEDPGSGGITVNDLTLFRPDGASRLLISSVGLGFYGTTAKAKQEVTGSAGGNAALESLLTALANYGLITDSST